LFYKIQWKGVAHGSWNKLLDFGSNLDHITLGLSYS